jgi:hypothetical protein
MKISYPYREGEDNEDKNDDLLFGSDIDSYCRKRLDSRGKY